MDEVLQRVSRDLPFQRSTPYLFDPVGRMAFVARDQRTLAELQIENRAVFCLIPYVRRCQYLSAVVRLIRCAL